MAVDDGFGDKKKTYFIPIVTWNKTAENVANYTHKGSLVAVTGKIITRNYDNKEGKKVYVTEVVAHDVKFLDSKNTGSNQTFESDIAPVDDGDCPF